MVRVVLLAAALLAVIEVSLADTRLPLKCKNIARDVIINSCKGPRSKRSADTSDLEKMNQETLKLVGMDAVEATSNDESHANQQKRQFYVLQPRISYRIPYGYGLPGQDYVSDTYHQADLNLPGLGINVDNQYGSMTQDTYIPPMPIPYQPMGYGVRSANPDGLLGFSLSPEELEELHEEIGDRMPRNSKDLNKKIFQHVAAKCCSNAKLCYDNPSLIPCMGY